ncbi:MAG: hypothetical protein Q9P01_04830, partial [Anaerolineae bacterium]|nr:hypothetical protein [Anaerolineae bacterium]
MNWLPDFQYLNVADIASEATHDYRWSTQNLTNSFATEVRESAYVYSSAMALNFPDGYRLIDNFEEFTFENIDDEADAILATRVHSAFSGQFQVYVNNEYVDTKVIP